MHILWTIANNPSVPYFSWFGELAKGRKDLQFTFVALCKEQPAMMEEMIALGHSCYWIPFDDRKRKSSMLSALPALYKLFRKLKPDVVHSHLFDDSLPAMLAAKLAAVPCRVITKQDTGFHWYFARKWVKADRFNNANATHLIAVSSECRDFLLEKEKAQEKKIHLIHHGINIPQLTRQNKQISSGLIQRFQLEGKKVIGTIARLIEWKGHRHIIHAAKSALEKNPDLVFLFTGTGPLRGEYEALIGELNLDKQILFTGWISREEIPSLYGIMDLYLHTASLEPFGFVIAEALANGVPVLSTPTGSARDCIKNGYNGSLLPDVSSETIAAKIDELLKTGKKVLQENAKRTALELFPVELMFERHLELYRKGLGQ